MWNVFAQSALPIDFPKANDGQRRNNLCCALGWPASASETCFAFSSARSTTCSSKRTRISCCRWRQRRLRDRAVLRVARGSIFLALVFLAPVLVDDVSRLGEPQDVFGKIDNVDRSEELGAVTRRTAKGLEKFGGDKDWDVVRLEIECAGSLFDGQPGGRLAKQGKEMAVVIFHKCGPCWAARPTAGPSLPLGFAIVCV